MSVTVISEIVQKNGANFAIVNESNVAGGYRSVADTTARDAIPSGVRKQGMLVFTLADSKTWALESDLVTWTEKNFGGSFRVAADHTARDALPAKSEGMWVLTLDDGIVWQLASDLTTWRDVNAPAAFHGITTVTPFAGQNDNFAIGSNTVLLINGGLGGVVTFTGFSAGVNGQLLLVSCVSGVDFTLLSNNAGSSAGNKLLLSDSSLVVGQNGLALLYYDASALSGAGAWRNVTGNHSGLSVGAGSNIVLNSTGGAWTASNSAAFICGDVRYKNSTSGAAGTADPGGVVCQTISGSMRWLSANGAVNTGPLANVALTGQTASIGTTALVTSPAAGLYEIDVYLAASTPGTSGTATVTISWTDDSGATSQTSGTLTFGAAGRQSMLVLAEVASGNISYSTTVTANVGGVYTLRILPRRVQ